MPITVRVWDEQVPGQRSPVQPVTIHQPRTTVREILRQRVCEEVERHNQSLPEVFCGLVQPEESERILNGFRMTTRRPLDWKKQLDRACSSFERNGFLVLVDGAQIAELDQPVDLRPESEIQFIKLVPLVGG